MVTALAVLAAFAVAVGATGWIVSRQPRRWLVDHPGARSLHDRPVSRAGGVTIATGLATGLATITLAVAPTPAAGWVLVGAALIATVSFVDDVRRVSPAIRIVCHFAAAACLVPAGLAVERIVLPGAVLVVGPSAGVAFTLLFVVWLVNLYNFMDGMDGFAGGMTAIGFTTLAGLAAGAGVPLPAGVSAVVAAAALGFLPFNFPPAKIFMGDLGAALLGYLCAVVMLWTASSAAIPLWISCLVFSPFIVDASVTLVRRTVAGERPWRAHRSHFFHRLVLLGWGHRKTVLREYVLMLACAGSAAVALRVAPGAQAALLGAWAATYVILMRGVARLEGKVGI